MRYTGGPIGLVRDGDTIKIDADNRVIDITDATPEELQRRQLGFKAPPLKYQKGTLYKYAKIVSDASHGCITDM